VTATESPASTASTRRIGGRVRANLSTAELYEDAVRAGEGVIAAAGPLVVRTGKHTGRSPLDKFIVKEASSDAKIWWGPVNRPISEQHYDGLRARLLDYVADRTLYAQDCWIGAHEGHRRSLRVYTETAWASIFARNLFRRPTAEGLASFAPNFTILCVPSFKADPAIDGTRTSTAILLHLERMEIIIVGTEYAGEIKKSAFTVMNYLMPDEGVLPMHSAVNVGAAGDSVIFFGLSGTGKTTLSADPERVLVGDDEHGWGDDGVFNFEGGCYAKVINLSEDAEPQIFRTTRTFGTILENVVLDERGVVDFEDSSKTENTRAAYKLEQIANALPAKRAGHPRSVIFLTADAFGILPPIARLTRDQAMYWFLSGFTAKLAGTEIGVKEPQPTFSACFGAPFLPQHPVIYARLLAKRLDEHGSRVWLVNTGWTGGQFGEGERMPIGATRALLRAALSGELDDVETRTDALFGFEVPVEVPGVLSSLLDPRSTWADPAAYDAKARELADMFKSNFTQFTADDNIVAGGPR
jgi:phosphoenolpyruvate carboxykinase (ATP)